MNDESLETALADGWKLFIASIDNTFFQNDAIRDLCAACMNGGSNIYDVLNSYVTLSNMGSDDVFSSSLDERTAVYKLVLPLLCGHGVSNMYLRNYFKNEMQLTLGADRTLRFVQEFSIPYLMSSYYEHYMYEVCEVLNLPYSNTYSTILDMDYWNISHEESESIKQIADEISCMTPMHIPSNCSCVEDLPKGMKKTLSRLDEIFEQDIVDFQMYQQFSSSTVLGSREKAIALMDINHKTEFPLCDSMFVCSSPSDAISSNLVKQAGGLTIAFNGCLESICMSDIAITSDDTTILSFFADVFQNMGKESVIDLVENWSQEAIMSSSANSYLKRVLLDVYKNNPPIVVKV